MKTFKFSYTNVSIVALIAARQHWPSWYHARNYGLLYKRASSKIYAPSSISRVLILKLFHQ